MTARTPYGAPQCNFRYESEYRIEDSSISDNEFTYDGHQYRVPGVWVDRHSIGNETPRPPFRIPERSRFNLQFETCRRSTVQQDTMSVNDVPAQPKDGVPVTVVCGFTDDSYEDWTLHVEYDDVEVELPFHEARLVPGDQFRWWGIEFYQLHTGWTSGKPESTEGGGWVSVLKRQEGAPLNLG